MPTRCSQCTRELTRALKCLVCGRIFPYFCPDEHPQDDIHKVMLHHTSTCDGFRGLYLGIGVRIPLVMSTEYFEMHGLDISIYQDAYGQSMISTCYPLYLCQDKYKRLEYLYQNDRLGSLNQYRIDVESY
ncbi:hypothetical protein RF11_00592 [Thelohanellus kitauei]|uniref:Uncharacterized protein n=1 Tax=Thelohanellus kitauei TaxID=669202 RepID=A0A0C2IVG7_THEKT|nr:hypothetical protein RF11_00592 [Thelohanellus kitauei]